jgi:hypothetical protein
VPLVGGLVGGSKSAYRYLPNSLTNFPGADDLAERFAARAFATHGSCGWRAARSPFTWERHERTAAGAQSDRDLYALVEDLFSDLVFDRQRADHRGRAAHARGRRQAAAAAPHPARRGSERRRRARPLAARGVHGTDPRRHADPRRRRRRAQTRRGVNATAVDFGNRVSVLAGDYLFAWIFKNVTANYARPSRTFSLRRWPTSPTARCCSMRARANLDLPFRRLRRDRDQEDGRAVRGVGRMRRDHVGRLAAARRALRDFGLYYGIAFQMLDDLLDLTASEAELGKPVGNDLRERKMTAPLILALESAGAESARALGALLRGADA